MTALRRLPAILLTIALGLFALVATPTVASAQIYTSGVFSVSYNGDLYQVDKSTGRIHKLTYREWLDLGSPSPNPVTTDFVKYAWSPTVYAVSFFGSDRSEWVWNAVTFDEWSHAGSPAPRSAGWIAGSSYYQWATSPEVFVLGADGVRHKLTGPEWGAAGSPSPDRRSNEGFITYSWDPTVVHMTDLAGGQGYGINAATWAADDRPTPQVVNRVTGDQVYQTCGSSDIWYAGPGLNRRLTPSEWQRMGSPAPTVKGAPCGSTKPPRPTENKNCRDFPSRAAAQAEFDRLFPYYGDVYGLDRDGDGRVCEWL